MENKTTNKHSDYENYILKCNKCISFCIYTVFESIFWFACVKNQKGLRKNLTLFRNECWCGCWGHTRILLQWKRKKKSIKEEGTTKKRRKKGSSQLQTTGELEERRRISTFNNVLPREPTLCLCPRERKKESFI